MKMSLGRILPDCVLTDRPKTEPREMTPSHAATVSKSEVDWCEKELGYLQTELAANDDEMAKKRIDRIRSQLDYVDEILSDIEDEVESD